MQTADHYPSDHDPHLLFELLPHRGSSGTEIRLALLSNVLCLLCCREIAVIYADREFIGQEWIQGLARVGIPISRAAAGHLH